MLDDRTEPGDQFEDLGVPEPDFDLDGEYDDEPVGPSLADKTDDDFEFTAPRGDNPWERRAGELADWALARVFVRTDRYISYWLNGDKITSCTYPANGPLDGVLTREIVMRHFTATRPGEVLVAHAITPGEGSRGKWVGFDIDAHTEKDDPARNRRYVEHLHAKLARLGFHPLTCTWGTGGFHVWLFFNQEVPGQDLFAFAQWCVADATTEAWGFRKPIEAFPKQKLVPAGGCGNGLRLIGRHKKHPRFAAVFNGKRWDADHWAVSLILSRTGDSPALIPADARPKPVPARSAATTTPGASLPQGDDVFFAYNQSVTLAEVVGWHESVGHEVTSRPGEAHEASGVSPRSFRRVAGVAVFRL
jgi:hypothetical protein